MQRVMVENDDLTWVMKYRPKTIDQCILPDDIKQRLNNIIVSGNVPNLLLFGPPGCGKTTAAYALISQLDGDMMFVPGEKCNIDTLRIDVANFASTRSLLGKKKFVIIDEADYLNSSSVQPALRSFMQDYSDNCRFILTANFPARIMEPLHSRMSAIDFTVMETMRDTLGALFFKRAREILELENVQCDRAILANIVGVYYPDFRRVLNELQGHVGPDRTIIPTILSTSHDIDRVYAMLKNHDFKGYRAWVAENVGNQPPAVLFRALFDHAHKHVEQGSIPALILILAEYQHKAAFVADQEINTTAALVEIEQQCKLKK